MVPFEVVKIKGPNPFAPWEEDPGAISGRKDESRIFNGFSQATASKQTGLLAVVGGQGTGKTALLRHFRHSAEKSGMLAPYVQVERGEGLPEVLDKLCQEMALEGGKKASADSVEKLLLAVERAQAGTGFGAVIFIDDIDSMKKADEAVSAIGAAAKASWGKRSVSFVVSSTRELKLDPETATVMVLRPFNEQEARDFMEKALGKGPPKMGEECLASILADSGGNPRLLKSISKHIYDKLKDTEKVITKGHYLAYMQYIMSMLSREWFGAMYQETPAAERTIVKVMASADDGMHVSDIARKIGKPLGPVTALTKRLLDSGQIIRMDRGKYKVFARLYAKYVMQRG
ncbi:ATP-binding protein [Candidatus Micrarchaeota archaeon]|nr:ATP-binding protein [Candidatus Micrarchaeota archaeon]